MFLRYPNIKLRPKTSRISTHNNGYQSFGVIIELVVHLVSAAMKSVCVLGRHFAMGHQENILHTPFFCYDLKNKASHVRGTLRNYLYLFIFNSSDILFRQFWFSMLYNFLCCRKYVLYPSDNHYCELLLIKLKQSL